MNILCVVGARPNFVKVAPVYAALLGSQCRAQLLHTGQHYDHAMSQAFFDDLGIPAPTLNLHVGSASHAVQTAQVMQGVDTLLDKEDFDAVLVAGDINSALAAALVAAKRGIAVAHLEAGLRSFDRSMPEEINRVLIDHMASFLLTPSADADANLLREGLDAQRIFRVGNAMIDSLRHNTAKAQAKAPQLHTAYGVTAKHYALATLHRAGNVDDPRILRELLGALEDVSGWLPVLLPLHPRTLATLRDAGLSQVLKSPTLRCLPPLGYLDFLALQMHAQFVITDSGGIQEESTALGIPCLTTRLNTERPVTVDEGTNTVVGQSAARIKAAAWDILQTGGKAGRIPALWDGHTAARVVDVLRHALDAPPSAQAVAISAGTYTGYAQGG